MSKITLKSIKKLIKSRLKTEFDIIKDAEVHRLKQSSTYIGIVGLVASVGATTQLDASEYWMTLASTVVSLYFIYHQKKAS